MGLPGVTTDPSGGVANALMGAEANGEATFEHPFCASLGRVPAAHCANCHVRKRGANCWEADGSPCCSLSRQECPTCEVTIAYLRATSEARRARLTTTQGLEISGYITVPKGSRFSDYLNQVEREFLAITDAVIERPRGHPSRTDAPVVLVNKREICLLIPDEGEAEQGPLRSPAVAAPQAPAVGG
ncbi:MAG: hypothetical protein ACE5R4_14015 [Armatimonadota bacterium]